MGRRLGMRIELSEYKSPARQTLTRAFPRNVGHTFLASYETGW